MVQPRANIAPRHVESRNSAVIKVFRRSLASGVTREGWLAIEGPILFEEALRAGGYLPHDGRGFSTGLKIQSVLTTERQAERFSEALRRLPEEVEVNLVADSLFERVSQTETPQGIAALVELRRRDLDAVLRAPSTLAVVACELQDPGNLGTIMRSAQALGATALAALRNTVSPFNPKTVRSSAGAVFRLPVFTALEPDSLIERLHRRGVSILAADRRSSVRVQDANFRGPTAILIGKEAAGLDESLARRADQRVAIPIRGEIDSLNAAAAASIVLYEAARQRGFHFDESV